MAQNASIDPKNLGISIDDRQKITVTVTWDATDTPLTAADTYQFDKDTNIKGTGELTILEPAGGTFPVTVNFVLDPDGGRSATASITVQGKTPGQLGLKGSTPKGTLARQCPVNVFPLKVYLQYQDKSGFTNPVMQVTDTDYDLTTAPTDAKSTLVVQALDASDRTTPVGPLYPVNLRFYDVRDTQSDIAGKFYANGNQVTPARGTWNQTGAQVSTVTDDSGLVTLTVIANDNDGYIKCYAADVDSITPNADLFLINTMIHADPDLGDLEYDGPKDLTGYNQPTVPIAIRYPNADPTEVVALFLNQKFEGETEGSKFAGQETPTIVTALTADLVTTTNPQDISTFNQIFYCATHQGDLRYSRTLLLPLTGTLPVPDPTPTNPILSNMIQPTGLIINMGSLRGPNNEDRTVNVLMNVQADVAILKDKMKIDLSTAQKIRITLFTQGDYYETQKFQADKHVFDTDITAAMLTDPSVSVDIPRDYLYGYGTPEDKTKAAKYTIWYGYVNASTDADDFASCPLVTGPLSTGRL